MGGSMNMAYTAVLLGIAALGLGVGVYRHHHRRRRTTTTLDDAIERAGRPFARSVNFHQITFLFLCSVCAIMFVSVLSQLLLVLLLPLLLLQLLR